MNLMWVENGFPDALSFLLDCSFNQLYIDGFLATNQIVLVES